MHHHRSTLKQTKPNRASSKRPTGEDRGSVKKLNHVAPVKLDRRNNLAQLRQQKKEAIITSKRMGVEDYEDSREIPPKVVAIVNFHKDADALSLKRRVLVACGLPEDAVATLGAHQPATVVLPPFAQGGPAGKSRVLLIDPPRDTLSVLDVVKCADVLICVLPPCASLEDPAFDDQGYRLLTAIKAQGLPVTLGAIHGSADSMAMATDKKIATAKKFVTRYFASELGADVKLLPAHNNEEMKTLVRNLGGVTPKEMSWRADRAYMLAQEAQYSSADGVLRLAGYVRGPGLSCKHLVHLTGHGDFSLARLAVLPDPCPLTTKRGAAQAPVGEQVVDELKEEPDTRRLQPYDPMSQEQTFPTDEEMRDAQLMPPPPVPAHALRKKRGAAAIPAPAKAAGASEGEGDAEMEGNENPSENDGDSESVAPPSISETDDGWDVSSNMTMDIPSLEAVTAERKARAEMIARSMDELEFPDEVDTPLEVPARERFARYRGLKSYRTSTWDPYEELPVEYSRIWEFEAFTSTARAFRQKFEDDCYEQEGGGVSALYCAVYIKGVPPSVLENQAKGVPFVLSNLFPCEQKVSVVHANITTMGELQDPIKSKREVSLHCGFRRLIARPSFSEAPRGSSTSRKWRFLRYLHQDTTACASFYAPIVFPPSRVMMFLPAPDAGTEPQLVAAGSIDGVDPQRLLIKRIILTGYPFRVHKSKGVVRFMFFNPTDIRWFKPVELSTKRGLRGHVLQAIGSHGYMKCRFSNHIKQDDTVCMNLYKRVYPKWFPPSWGGDVDATAETA